MEVVRGAFGHCSDWFLALEISRASVLKPDLWKGMKKNVSPFIFSFLILRYPKGFHETSVYLNLRLW